jgi:hypothetical protein
MAYIPKNFPAIPIPPYPGDDVNPPFKGNTGMGMKELSALVILHALLSNPRYYDNVEQAVPDAFNLAEDFYQEIFQ